MTVSLTDIAWVAGLLEGEGHFAYKTSPTITIGQTDRDVVDRMDLLVGPGHRWTQRHDHPNWKPCHYWQLSGNRAVQVMMTVLGFMCSRRRERIIEILDVWKSKRVRLPKGMGLRNPSSPFYAGPNARRAAAHA